MIMTLNNSKGTPTGYDYSIRDRKIRPRPLADWGSTDVMFKEIAAQPDTDSG